MTRAGLTGTAAGGSDSADVYELGCRDQSVSAADAADWSAPRRMPAEPLSGPSRAAEKILFLPDQHLGRNTAFAMGIPTERDGRVGSVPDQRRPQPGPAEGGEGDSVEGPLLGPSAISARACRSRAPRASGDAGHRASRVPLGGLPEGRRDRFDGADYRGHREGSRGLELCRWHGDSSGQPAREAVSRRSASES